MTRAEAIAVIQRRLVEADDETICAVAEQLSAGSVEDENWELRPLTPRELGLIEQSKADFREGRTMTLDEARRALDDSLEKLGVPRSGR